MRVGERWAGAERPEPRTVSDGPGLIADWEGRLTTYRERVREEPQFNPIWQLAFDISCDLEAGQIARETLYALAKSLSDQAFLRRAERSRAYVGSLDPGERSNAVRGMVRASAYADGDLVPFEAFAAHWNTPRNGVVFTAHPTFAMSERLRGLLVRLIEAKDEEAVSACLKELAPLPHAPDPNISLASEHQQVQQAIAHAQAALAHIHALVLDVARELYPDRWTELRPNAVEISSWVGYDLDGRTDITWQTSLHYRLDEKRRQLERYGAAVEKAIQAVGGASEASTHLRACTRVLAEGIAAAEQHAATFANSLGDPDALSKAANAVTHMEAGGLGATTEAITSHVMAALDSAADEEARTVLMRLLAAIADHGLGTAKIHIRINATQLHNAIRKPMDLEQTGDVASRVLLERLDELITATDREAVNFASLAVETATATRQLILCAQILKHIDSEAPIRLLIAECEQPFTILAAVYFARLFGVDHKIDISPLFETPDALDRGVRVIEALLKTESYRAQILKRGRICIQTGFSDSGRFIGQIPAGLAIERLQGQLAEVVRSAGLGDVEVRIFDTHGESMGRGAHPASLRDRFAYVLSPWIRARYRARGLRLMHETSFQGGDGYVLFGSPRLALATLTEVLASDTIEAGDPSQDRFYADFGVSKDYFERVKAYQARLFEDPNYRAALGAFGTRILPKTGSRKSERQYDAGRDARAAVAEMRAIPHNALLQQLGFLLNVVSGIGDAVRDDRDRFAEMYEGSDRAHRLMSLVSHARQLSSIKTLVAYANLFDDAFWVTRPHNDLEPHLKEPCIYLADLLRGDDRHDCIMHLASFLRRDAVRLRDVFGDLGFEVRPSWESGRLELDILHAIRIALIQHIYLLAARVPPFSARNDISQTEILGLVLSLRIDDAVALLREAFPMSRPRLSDYHVKEPATYMGDDRSDYGEINRNLIDPMLDGYRALLEIAVGISHHYGAYG